MNGHPYVLRNKIGGNGGTYRQYRKKYCPGSLTGPRRGAESDCRHKREHPTSHFTSRQGPLQSAWCPCDVRRCRASTRARKRLTPPFSVVLPPSSTLCTALFTKNIGTSLSPCHPLFRHATQLSFKTRLLRAKHRVTPSLTSVYEAGLSAR